MFDKSTVYLYIGSVFLNTQFNCPPVYSRAEPCHNTGMFYCVNVSAHGFHNKNCDSHLLGTVAGFANV